MPWHARAVVREEKDNRVVSEAVVFELLQDIADLFVHGRDAVVETCDGLANNRRVRVVRRERGFGRVVDFVGRQAALDFFNETVVRPDHRAGLV